MVREGTTHSLFHSSGAKNAKPYQKCRPRRLHSLHQSKCRVGFVLTTRSENTTYSEIGPTATCVSVPRGIASLIFILRTHLHRCLLILRLQLFALGAKLALQGLLCQGVSAHQLQFTHSLQHSGTPLTVSSKTRNHVCTKFVLSFIGLFRSSALYELHCHPHKLKSENPGITNGNIFMSKLIQISTQRPIEDLPQMPHVILGCNIRNSMDEFRVALTDSLPLPRTHESTSFTLIRYSIKELIYGTPP